MNEEIRYFQWIASEKRGEIVIFDKIETEDGEVFISFKDGSRINEKLVAQINEKDASGKFMAEIDSPNNAWQFHETWVGREEEKWEANSDGQMVCVQPFIEGKKVTKLFPPKPTAPKKSNFGAISVNRSETESIPNINMSVAKQDHQINDKISDDIDPVHITLSRAKKIDTTVELELTLSLPSVDLYRILTESFEGGQESILTYIVSSIDTTDIKSALKESLRLMYEREK